MTAQRILLVEDDDDVSELFLDALREEGYCVDLAKTVAEAWVHLDAHSYTLVISDWRLPDGDGTSIVAAAAQLGAKTFLMSGYLPQMPGGRAEGHENIMKPITPSELVLAVRRAIGGPGQ
jgi:DNA-binding response OmpR family regulator